MPVVPGASKVAADDEIYGSISACGFHAANGAVPANEKWVFLSFLKKVAKKCEG